MISDMFEWDEAKSWKNYRKHRVSFEHAADAFADPLMVTWPDFDHSDEEQRFISIGRKSGYGMLSIVHTDRGDRIRIISARRATRQEVRLYEETNRL